MGAFAFAGMILLFAAVLDKLLPEEAKARMVDKFMEGGERFGRH